MQNFVIFSLIRYLYKKAVIESDTEEEELTILQRSSSRRDSLRKLLPCKSRLGSLSLIHIEDDCSPGIQLD